jgi:hypothetical protein
MTRSILIGGCGDFCAHRHTKLKDGWIPTCDAYPDSCSIENELFYCTRKCANGLGFELAENADLKFMEWFIRPDPMERCMRHYLQYGTPGKCGSCQSDAVRFYSDAPLTPFVTFVCYGCGRRYRFQTGRNQYLNKRQLRYIGNDPMFPLTYGKIYQSDWIEYGMYWIMDDKNELYLYPLYVFEILYPEADADTSDL